MEHLDIDIAMANSSPIELATIQPVDNTSPIGGPKVAQNPNIIISNSGNNTTKGAVNNFMV